MKTFLMACTALWASAACAQTSVVLYGSIDAGLRHLSNVDAEGHGKTSMASSGTSYSNRLGFKGSEDLGDGLNTHFMLETGFITGTGALDNSNNVLFNRASYVGIGNASQWVDVGRQYNVVFKTLVPVDPFKMRYPLIVLTLPATAGIRSNNSVQYTGLYKGFTARAEYALGEVAGSVNDGSTKAAALSYASGGFYTAATYTVKRTAAVGSATYYDYRHYATGAAYSTTSFRFTTGYADEKQATAALDTTNKYAWLGVNYFLSPVVELGAAVYGIDNNTAGIGGRRRLLLLNATYNLSKSSNLYAAYDRGTFHGSLLPATKQSAQTGFSVGLMHLF